MPKDNEAPSFQFYPDDFTSDGKVEVMTTEEVGAYLLLICKAWREKPAATVPNDDRILARWARMTPERWAECKAAVMAPWKLLSGSLRWQQPRLKKEYDKMLARRRFNHERATSGAKARWGSNASSSPPPPSIPEGKKEPPNPRKRGDSAGTAYPPGFIRFWEEMPPQSRDRSSKAEAFGQWKTLKLEPVVQQIIEAVLLWKSSEKWADGFAEGAHRWLKNRKYEEKPELKGKTNGHHQFQLIGGNNGGANGAASRGNYIGARREIPTVAAVPEPPVAVTATAGVVSSSSVVVVPGSSSSSA